MSSLPRTLLRTQRWGKALVVGVMFSIGGCSSSSGGGGNTDVSTETEDTDSISDTASNDGSDSTISSTDPNDTSSSMDTASETDSFGDSDTTGDSATDTTMDSGSDTTEDTATEVIIPCGTCHGIPPSGTHPQQTACESCHSQVVASFDETTPDNTVWADASLHRNGTINVDTLACNACHGSTDNNAPPTGTNGETATTDAAVGAHQSHLQITTGWHRDVGCNDCHDTPATAIHSDGTIDFNWSTLAGTVTYDIVTTTCSDAYCHGAALAAGDGSNTTPDWTLVDDSQDACGTCHNLPPGGTHTTSTTCEDCHGAVIASFDAAIPSNSTWTDATLHINGEVNVTATGCNTCHDATPTSGAHTEHLASGFSCAFCHGHSGSGAEHDNGVLTIAFGDYTFASGLTSLQNGGTASYDNNNDDPYCYVGCHNPAIGDTASLTNQVFWNNGSLACVQCHEHVETTNPIAHNMDGANVAEARANCQYCHDTGAHTSGTIHFADPDTNDGMAVVDGDASTLCMTCHDGDAATYFNGATAPSKLTYFDPADPGSHYNAGIGCTDCHGYHGATNDTDGDLAASNTDSALCLSCHNGSVASVDIAAAMQLVSAHDVPLNLQCQDCHDVHSADDSPRSIVIDPKTRAELPVADNPVAGSAVDTGVFCLGCHDGTWNGALDMATELGSGALVSEWTTNNKSKHVSHDDDPNGAAGQVSCVYCHAAHGSDGTSGINRGRLLQSWLSIDAFPYSAKGSCSMAGGGSACH